MRLMTIDDMTIDDLQALNLTLDIQPCSAVLKGVWRPTNQQPGNNNPESRPQRVDSQSLTYRGSHR